MTGISQENQNLAQFAGKIFGDDWTIAEHLDEQQNHVVYVLTATNNADTSNLRSYATIGLSDYKLGQDKSDIPLGAELVGCVSADIDYFDQVLADVANAILKQNLLCKPGTVFANALSGQNEKAILDHLLFTVPSMWEDGLYPLKFKSKTVLWLQAIPISQAEMEYAQKHGPGELGEKLTNANADLTDMARASVI